MSESFSIPTPGDVIAGKYRVMQELGRGAYGVVFRAEQIGLDRSVALKTLLPQAFLQVDIVQRFHREAQLISRLDHENVIKLYDYGVDEGLLYMAVEYVEGRTLGELIKDEAPLPPSKVREIVDQILSALTYAHAQGIVHRDLKPDNILLLKSRPLEGIVEEVVKILDFGIAKLVQAEHEEGALKTLTQDGTVLGTPHYMSPENIVGDSVDNRTDLYALGVIMYEMLVGEHPFEASSPSAVMVRHLRDDPPHLPEPLKGSSFDVAILAALEKQPLDRVESAAAMRELLDATPMPSDDAQLEAGATAAVVAEVTAEDTHKSKAAPLWGIVLILAFLAVSVTWKLFFAADVVENAGDGEVVTSTNGADGAEKPDEPATNGAVAEVEPAMDAGGEELEGFEFGEDAGLAIDAGPAEEPDEETKTPSKAPDKTRQPKRPERKPTNSAAKKEEVQLVVTSHPPKASVTVDGVPVGETPVRRKVAKGDDALTVRVSLLGYKNQQFKVTPSKDVEIDARLEFDRIKMLD